MKRAVVLLIVLSFFVSGCAFNIYKKSPKDKKRIEALSSEVERLNEERELERQQFEDMKRDLSRGLRGKVGLDIEERGLVITLSNNIIFDSGKAQIKEDAQPVLDRKSVV